MFGHFQLRVFHKGITLCYDIFFDVFDYKQSKCTNIGIIFRYSIITISDFGGIVSLFSIF